MTQFSIVTYLAVYIFSDLSTLLTKLVVPDEFYG